MDSGRTTTRQYSEYSDFFSTQREREYDQDTDLPQRESTQVRRGGRDGRREPDSGLGHTQDYRTRWTDDDWVDPDSFTQRTEQLVGRKRRAGGRPAVNRIPEETVVHRDSRWDIPGKRAMSMSDGPDSTTSGSDIPEGHAYRPPEVEYSEGLISRRPQNEGGAEGLCSPNRELEMALIRLQKDFDDCRMEFELVRKHTPAGDALNVSLLVPESRRVVPGFLIKSLSDHYISPGRLAEYKRQFQRAFRHPAMIRRFLLFELEMLARRAFIDIDISIQLQMVRDRFIDGQVECALRRHLDSLGPDTHMADIVDCCRVWESHRDVDIEPRMSADRCPSARSARCRLTNGYLLHCWRQKHWRISLGGYCPRRRYRPLRWTQYHRTGIYSFSD